MERNGDAENSQRASSNKSKGKADAFLIICRCFNVVAALAAILCVVVNILSAIRSFKHGADIFDGVYRCFAAALAIFVVAVETEWGYILQFWKVLEYWVGRGILQIFVAVMTRAFPDTSPDNSSEQNAIIVFQNIASYMLLACGAVYIISGILCLGYLKRRRQNQQTSREQAKKDLDELERRREELRALLVEDGV